MTEIFKMPDIGEGMAEGEISNWLVKVGDQVKTDDSVAEVQNDKLLQEILSPYSGKVTKLFVDAGTTVQVGQPLIEFDGDGSGSSAETPAAGAAVQDNSTTSTPAPAPAPAPAASEQPQSSAPAAPVASNGNVLAMPSVRHFAFEHHLDLAQVPATGRHGHITMADAQKAVEQPQQTAAPAASAAPVSASPEPAPAPVEVKEGRVAMTPIRKAIAKAMATQNATIPTVTNFDQIEVSKLVEHRKQFKAMAADQSIHLTYLAYAVKALAATAKKFPELNASVDMDKQEIVYHDDINIGVAVSAPNGLFVPVVAQADRKSILTIAQEIEDLAAAVRDGSIKGNQMHGATITISNLGSARGTWFTPIINAKEVAILGLGSIVKEPIVADDGSIVAGQVMKFSLSYDHRLIDGMLGQTSLNYFKTLMADPAYMLMEV
ncbi:MULTISPECIES: dihydrolipoamide acetyltransferase family protein [Oenococcus]|uniref:Dihydrolipoamide acetyltransferase component of pyruvate dehydrogenase complex n=1 Tax=Oenococcus kitaharae DSM 17330 TaxID=1045004 RepID=G9WI29_9LACO|nr:dihydrolipoamide acetyltransferase family protein [Oenococcus kitaharae]EHN58914.1 Dihydrolipoamide acetyltransferase component (E2) of acetoin dehydrogenase complex [Oenococcus kitaharae DSM 17330]OEY81768.1 dienelactone hydrolase [Oenococcus kitaharae]OEY83999.1 dienelactone hydrolase [Oenococcus kitaharae]OEY85645.1 dienelactone hydrolase [Oenococcus kitaharae]